MGSTSLDAGLNRAEAACVLALLRAAKPRGLRLWHNLHAVISPTSQTPNKGWYQRSTWDFREVSSTAGGPWSVELVERVASLGLIGVNPHGQADEAEITAAGRKFLKDAAALGNAEPRPASRSLATHAAPNAEVGPGRNP